MAVPVPVSVPLPVAPNRINVLPMSGPAAYFISQTGLMFPPTWEGMSKQKLTGSAGWAQSKKYSALSEGHLRISRVFEKR